jgi:prevent-host-death family protein
MQKVINAKTLRSQLAKILKRVQKGERYTIIYRSRPVCEVVPLGSGELDLLDLDEEPLYGAKAVGRSSDGKTAADHDEFLYGRRRRR